MSRPISKQLEHAVHHCFTAGHSKRADKFNANIETDWKIYSLSYRRDMLDLAKDLGKFLKEKRPQFNKAYLIGKDEIQEYINQKASTCVDKTLEKIISRLGKLEKCCQHTYPKSDFMWNIHAIVKPISTKNAKFVKDTPVPLEVSKAGIEALEKRKSEVHNAIKLSAFLGMRAEETTCIKVENIHFTDGEFGYGWVEILRGAEGGAKGGRPRIIPIINEEVQQELKQAVKGKHLKQYIAERKDGKKMTPDNVQRTLREWMDSQYGNRYLGNRCHGMRKTWAQMYYDTVRKKGFNKKEAISKTNEVLGHGLKRGIELIRMYVKNIW